MTTQLQNAKTFERAWVEEAARRATAARETEFSRETRRVATGILGTLSFPSREHELWRRTDFRALEAELPALDPFATATPARNVDDLPHAILEKLSGEAAQVGLVVQRNGAVVLEQTHPDLTRQGIVVGSLDRGFREHEALLRPRYGSQIHPDYDWFTAFGAAVRSGGAFVYVPDGVEAALPIRLFQWLDGGGAISTPRTVVILGNRARATIVEELLSATTEGTSFHCGGTEVFLGEGAHLIYGQLQEWGRNVVHYSNQRVRLERDAELQWIQTLLGSRMAKTNSYFDLAGPGARAYVHGFMFGDAQQHFHLHTLQRHLLDHCTSDLLIKGCLKDHARSIYQGLIQVSEGAQRTDAYQANRNLLLSDTARADSIPGLEILANDVRCTHGATIGHVDDEQMYYLMARGLPRSEAQRLIVEGFFAPVLDRIPLESVRDQLRAVIARKIG
ncbi:MAG TPA: Fe-S cluster assembly protein SufD [Candidatus Sulfotelmatobacter sp.]|nr:Fe-S cluster assembly protein SufD [Candidatus Sulfotelmatobacter sp.]